MIISILSTITAILRPTSALIEKSSINDQLKNKLILSIQDATTRLDSELMQQQKELIAKELDGNWFQRSWRPGFAWVVITIIFNNYFILPYLNAMGAGIPITELPEPIWYLFTVGFGGYVAGRSFDKNTRAKVLEAKQKIEERAKSTEVIADKIDDIIEEEDNEEGSIKKTETNWNKPGPRRHR